MLLCQHPSSQGYGFSSSHIWMWELNYKESWALKNWCLWTMVLEKTLESSLDCREIQPVHPKWNRSWIFIGRTDAEADFLLLHSSPHLYWVLVLEGLVGLHRTVQLQLLKHYWMRHRLELPWYWMICPGNEQRSFCCFWDCIQVLYFRLFCWPWWLLHFL